MIVKQFALVMRFVNRSLLSSNDATFFTCAAIPLSSKFKLIISKTKHIPKKRFVVWKGITINELAKSMNMKGTDIMEVIQRKISNEHFKYSTEIHDMSILSTIAKACGGIIEEKKIEAEEIEVDKDVYRRDVFRFPDKLKPRPPVVTIMGHVDHGKTTLLDSLRSSRVVDSEFGGITQHIGAFKVSLSDVSKKINSDTNNQIVTFLDTPGHAAFWAMRSRGVQCTDIVVLVVAIEDGLMPQTIESIRFAKEAKVPIIVAVNKIDRIWKNIESLNSPKTWASFDPIERSLAKYGLSVERMGGDVQFIPISALKKWNLDLLQESILALAEVINVRSDYEGPCESVVLEANIIDGLGKVATVLVQQGCLKIGSIFIAGNSLIKIRTIKSDKGDSLKEGKPGDPVEVTGWKEVLPLAGDVMIEVENESRAREVLAYRKMKYNNEKSVKDYQEYDKGMFAYKSSYRSFMDEGYRKGFRLWRNRPQLGDFIHNERIRNGIEIPQKNLIVKTDVQGSLEAIEGVLEMAQKSCEDQCLVKIVSITVGNLTENDIELATKTDSTIYLFNLPFSISSKSRPDLDIRHFNVIYHMFDDLKDLITEKLPKISEIEIVGEAEVIQMFEYKMNKDNVMICGSKCLKGVMYKSGVDFFYRIIRPSKTDSTKTEIIKDKLACKNLRHKKTDVDSVKKGIECGIILQDKNEEIISTEIGDVIQCCKTVQMNQTLIWEIGFN